MDEIHCHEYINDEDECIKRGLDPKKKDTVHVGPRCNQPPKWVFELDDKTKAYWCDWCKPAGERFIDFYFGSSGPRYFKCKTLKPFHAGEKESKAKKRRKKRQGPWKIADVVQEITDHPEYANLSRTKKIEICECANPLFPRSKYQLTQDNQFLRKVWADLHLDAELET